MIFINHTYFICLHRRSARELVIIFLDDRFRFRLFSLFAIVYKMENNYKKKKFTKIF